MPYCSLDDLIREVSQHDLIELTDDKKESNTETPFSPAMMEVINAQIAKADAIINDMLRGKYIVPFSPVPEIIRNISCDITLFRIYSRRLFLEEADARKDRYEQAMKLLRSIQTGDTILDVIQPEPDIVIISNKRASDRVFTDEVLRKMV